MLIGLHIWGGFLYGGLILAGFFGNSVSYNKNNAIITTSRHIENPGIVRTVYSDIFSNIQPFSSILRKVKPYSAIFWIY